MGATYDFCGWATRNDLKCSDGRTIRRDAFKDNDGQVVPLVWNHQHGGVENVLGHALLRNVPEGVIAYGTFNDTEMGRDAKELVRHKDITHLSIYANRLKQNGGDVIHGSIKEVSLVLAGANPGASIIEVIEHGETLEDTAEIYNDDEYGISEEDILQHADEEPAKEETSKEGEEAKEMAEENKEKTVQDVIDEMTEEQRNVLYALVGQALEHSDDDYEDEGENNEMKHNVFDGQDEVRDENTLSHAEMELIFKDAPRYGSLKDSFMAHADGDAEVTYGIQDVDWLFPEARNVNNPPEWIRRDNDWVQKVMRAVHRSPFSRIKSQFANLTEDEARARGYIKGHLKKEQVFGLLKRTTTPTTVYKKQKMDKDDINDITDFDVVSWIKTEMRWQLDEELARAFLIGDGRENSDEDKIDELNIRPIWTDHDLFSVKVNFEVKGTGATEDDYARAFIRAAIKNRKNYKGSGNPILYTSEDLLSAMLLLTDGLGHDLYKSEQELCTKLRVREIVTIPQFEGLTREVNGETRYLYGIIVNLADYNVGADKGGSVDMFDDFDIDYNQYKYLIETRCSGALTKPFSAMVIESVNALPDTVPDVFPLKTLRREGETAPVNNLDEA